MAWDFLVSIPEEHLTIERSLSRAEEERFHTGLSPYAVNILNKCIVHFPEEGIFNLFELVQEAISPGYIFPSQNGDILETFYNICDYLLQRGLVAVRREMAQYILTERGTILKHFGTISLFEGWMKNATID